MLPTRIADPSYRNVVGQFQTRNAVPMPTRPGTPYIVVHHAAADYEPGRACHAIFQHHSARWPKYGRIGYHEVIQIEPDSSLRCYGVNPVNQQGAGVLNRNHECFHICAATHFGSTVPLQVWIDALALRVAAALQRWPGAQVVGHREIATPASPTSCPGDKWPIWKGLLIERARRLVAPGPRRVKGVPIYQQKNRSGPLAGHLAPGDLVTIDAVYGDGGGHLADGRGFVDLNALD